MEEDIKSPFAYLLVAMNYAKAAVENGGKVDMFDVHSLMDFGYGEGEIYIGIPMETYVGDEAKNRRYELYPTTNMWTFLMIDQMNGNTYHIQWSNKDLKYNQ